jgi:hypothetical protein
MLDRTAAALPEHDAEVLRRQIAAIERVQRWNQDRMAIIGFEDKAALPRIGNESEAHCLARVRLRGSSGALTASVMTHRGILSSLEFRGSPRTLRDGDWSVESVELQADDPGVSGAIDREEH